MFMYVHVFRIPQSVFVQPLAKCYGTAVAKGQSCTPQGIKLPNATYVRRYRHRHERCSSAEKAER